VPDRFSYRNKLMRLTAPADKTLLTLMNPGAAFFVANHGSTEPTA